MLARCRMLNSRPVARMRCSHAVLTSCSSTTCILAYAHNKFATFCCVHVSMCLVAAAPILASTAHPGFRPNVPYAHRMFDAPCAVNCTLRCSVWASSFSISSSEGQCPSVANAHRRTETPCPLKVSTTTRMRCSYSASRLAGSVLCSVANPHSVWHRLFS